MCQTSSSWRTKKFVQWNSSIIMINCNVFGCKNAHCWPLQVTFLPKTSRIEREMDLWLTKEPMNEWHRRFGGLALNSSLSILICTGQFQRNVFKILKFKPIYSIPWYFTFISGYRLVLNIRNAFHWMQNGFSVFFHGSAKFWHPSCTVHMLTNDSWNPLDLINNSNSFFLEMVRLYKPLSRLLEY